MTPKKRAKLESLGYKITDSPAEMLGFGEAEFEERLLQREQQSGVSKGTSPGISETSKGDCCGESNNRD